MGSHAAIGRQPRVHSHKPCKAPNSQRLVAKGKGKNKPV